MVFYLVLWVWMELGGDLIADVLLVNAWTINYDDVFRLH